MAQAMIALPRDSRRNDFESELTYFTYLDEETSAWLIGLQHIWNLWKKSPCVSKVLIEFFNTAPNPYFSVLRIIVNTEDFSNAKNKMSLAYTVMEIFSKWIPPVKHLYTNCLENDLKIAAFRLMNKQKNIHLIKLFASTFEFLESKNLFVPYIKDMIQKKKFKEASQLIQVLNMQNKFRDPEIILFPLILQNKINLAEELMAGQPDIQRTMVFYLDNLLSPNINLQSYIDSFIDKNNIPEVQMSLSHIKTMSKLVARLAKQYNLLISDVCPNLSQRRNEGALQFLLHRRYKENGLNTESFREMVKEAVGSNIVLQVDLIAKLANYDINEAVYFVRLYNIPKNKWPWSIRHIDEETFNEIVNSMEDTFFHNQDDAINFHEFKLPRECIKIINDNVSFDDFLDDLLTINIVGIDSEWKPSFGTKKTELALIQIATETNVYIFDVTTIGNELKDSWRALSLLLFDNKNILKLGYDIAQDITMMKQVIPALNNVRTGGEGYIDVLHLWRKLNELQNFEFPYTGDENFTNETLSKLVELCLGNRLNKSDQFSNWEKRPLRESQIIYAALDAYCLLEVYEVLASQCSRQTIPFLEICEKIQNISAKSPKKSKRSTRTSNDESAVRDDSQTLNQRDQQKVYNAQDFRCACDSMLGRLAKELRRCGCDVENLECSTVENRIILTKRNCDDPIPQFKPDKNYLVTQDLLEYQLLEVVKYFKIQISLADIFSRCSNCNSKEFAYISKEEMHKLIKRFSELTGNNLEKMFSSLNTNKTESENLGNRLDRNWNLSKNAINFEDCTTKYSVIVKCNSIPYNVLRKIHCFYVCEKCGQIYWDGSNTEKQLISVLQGQTLLKD